MCSCVFIVLAKLKVRTPIIDQCLISTTFKNHTYIGATYWEKTLVVPYQPSILHTKIHGLQAKRKKLELDFRFWVFFESEILKIVLLHASCSVSHGSYDIASRVLVAALILIEYRGIIFYHCFI